MLEAELVGMDSYQTPNREDLFRREKKMNTEGQNFY